MIESKYLEFVKVATLPRTDVYDIFSKTRGFKLGQVRWYGAWRQYCFFPCGETIWNKNCLADVQRFLEEIKK